MNTNPFAPSPCHERLLNVDVEDLVADGVPSYLMQRELSQTGRPAQEVEEFPCEMQIREFSRSRARP